jgi:hypothetical protein
MQDVCGGEDAGGGVEDVGETAENRVDKREDREILIGK